MDEIKEIEKDFKSEVEFTLKYFTTDESKANRILTLAQIFKIRCESAELKKANEKECEDCNGVGHFNDMSNCCGAFMNSDLMVCSDCKEHADYADCEECNGKGIIDDL